MKEFGCHYKCGEILGQTTDTTFYFVYENKIVGEVSIKKGGSLQIPCQNPKCRKITLWRPLK